MLRAQATFHRRLTPGKQHRRPQLTPSICGPTLRVSVRGVTPSVFDGLLEHGHNSRGFIGLRQLRRKGISARLGLNSRLSYSKRIVCLIR